MTTVAIVQEVLAQYRIDFYEQLRRFVADSDIELRLLYGKASGARAERRDEATLSWATPIENKNLGLGRFGTLVWQPVFDHIRDVDLVILEHANRQAVNYPLLAASKLRLGPKVAFWGHGANLQSGRPDGIAERFKRKTARLPHWWFAYTEGSAARVRDAGFPADRITTVMNAIDTSEYETVKVATNRQTHSCVFVGSLHEHKRIDFLLHAAGQVRRRVTDFRLAIAGDGPLRHVVEDWAARHDWIDYRGATFGPDKAALVSESSLMLMPGLVGLGVLDAFAAETPIVTTFVPYHSPEFEYLSDGHNGVVLPGSIDPEAYAATVADLLNDPKKLSALRCGCREASGRYSVHAMARNFAEGIRDATSLN